MSASLILLGALQNQVVFQIGVCVLQIRVSVFSKVSGSIKSGFFNGGNFQIFVPLKIGSCFWFKKFRIKFAQVSKIGFKVLGKVLAGKRFHFAKSSFSGLHFVWQSQVSKIGFFFLAKVSVSLAQVF